MKSTAQKYLNTHFRKQQKHLYNTIGYQFESQEKTHRYNSKNGIYMFYVNFRKTIIQHTYKYI